MADSQGSHLYHPAYARNTMQHQHPGPSSSSTANYSVLAEQSSAQHHRTYTPPDDAHPNPSAKRRRPLADDGNPSPSSSSSSPNSFHTRGKSDPEHSRRGLDSRDDGHFQHSGHAPSSSLDSDPHHNSTSTSNGTASNNAGTKRLKTARACDSCRRKKIRCDVIDDGSPPPGDPNNGNGGLTCAHCRQYGFNCTFFLPITETRFKKKREREAEEAAAAAAAAAARSGMQAMPGMHPLAYPPPIARPHPLNQLPTPAHRIINASQEWPPPPGWHPGAPHHPPPPPHHGLPPGSSPSSRWPSSDSAHPMSPRSSAGVNDRLNRLPPPHPPPGPPPGHDGGQPPPDTRVLGPTSLAYIVHSTAFVPGSAIEAHDLKHSQTFEVGASGDGIIKLNRSRQRNQSVTSSDDGDEPRPQIPDSIRGRLAGDVAEKLVNSYFEKIGYLWPVVTKSEFLHLSQPPPLLLYAMCGVAALDRNVPREVLSAVRIGLNALFRDNDILSNSNALTVRALLILSLHGDIHGSANVQSGTKLWNRLGVALRMAQDLGLHRDASRKDDDNSGFAHFLEQKRRIWGACVTADRIISVALGHPLTIDLTDCDVRLPSPFEILRYPTDLPSLPGVEQPFVFNTEMLKLSILFGRVQKTIYSPTGLMKATDEEITGLLSDIDQWKEMLPEAVQYQGPHSPPVAGILHVCHACIQMLFFRVFMRISYSCPKHLKFSLTIERMNNLIIWSRESIDWIDASGGFYVDTMQFVTYALVFCATVQYHAWIRRSDRQGLEYLGKLRDAVQKGSRRTENKEDLSLQAKASEIINLLYEAAHGQWANTPFTGNLNPTAGVENRRTTESVEGIVWRKKVGGKQGAPGGVYEVLDASLMLNDLPKGTVILGRNRAPALVRTESNDWRPVPGVLPDSASGQGVGQDGTGTFTPNGTAEKGNNSNVADGGDDGTDLPDLSKFTYLGGSVWQDPSGRPVDRRGSDLMVVLPGGQRLGGGGPDGEADLASILSGADPSQANTLAPATAFMPHNQQMTNDSMPSFSDLNANGSIAQLNSGGAGFGSTDNGANGTADGTGTNHNQSNGASTADGTLSNNLDMFSGGADPLMLNDPMMGILDWQAWQSYLAPFGGVNGSASAGGQMDLSNGQGQGQAGGGDSSSRENSLNRGAVANGHSETPGLSGFV